MDESSRRLQNLLGSAGKWDGKGIWEEGVILWLCHLGLTRERAETTWRNCHFDIVRLIASIPLQNRLDPPPTFLHPISENEIKTYSPTFSGLLPVDGLVQGLKYTIHNTQYTIHNTQYTIHNTQ